ncbi:MAG: acetone carboxylase gamma subunit, partial [Bacillariaceae sp.]
VFFLCATVLSHPYDTPRYVPKALAAISKHSFKRNAPLNIRDTVKKCCAEYKKTHMSDNWEVHRSVFTQEELEALEDVVSSPHYYA